MAEKRVIEIEVNTKGAVKSMDALEKATNDVSKSFAQIFPMSCAKIKTCS